MLIKTWLNCVYELLFLIHTVIKKKTAILCSYRTQNYILVAHHILGIYHSYWAYLPKSPLRYPRNWWWGRTVFLIKIVNQIILRWVIFICVFFCKPHQYFHKSKILIYLRPHTLTLFTLAPTTTRVFLMSKTSYVQYSLFTLSPNQWYAVYEIRYLEYWSVGMTRCCCVVATSSH